MANVLLLAVLSLDGCLFDSKDDVISVLHHESYERTLANADYILTDSYPISLLIENDSRSRFLLEATSENIIYTNVLLRLQLVDEIILYTVPFIAGRGKRLFASNIPTSYWIPSRKDIYKDGIICVNYRRRNP